MNVHSRYAKFFLRQKTGLAKALNRYGIPLYTILCGCSFLHPSPFLHRRKGMFVFLFHPSSCGGGAGGGGINYRFLHTPKFVLRSVIAQYSLLSQRMPAGPPQGLPLAAAWDVLDAPEDALPVEKDSDERLFPNFTECRMRRNNSCMTFCVSSWGVKRSVITRASMGAPSPRSICTVSAMDPFSVMRSARLEEIMIGTTSSVACVSGAEKSSKGTSASGSTRTGSMAEAEPEPEKRMG